MEREFNNNWTEQIRSEKKMRTYTEFKIRLIFEDYLNTIEPMQHKKAVTRFRVSAHGLAIERGRYTRPPTPLEQRICNVCPNKPIEDEFHFLMECDKAKDDRNVLFRDIAHICPNFNSLSERNKFIYLMSASDRIISIVAQFISKHLP